MWHLSFFYLLLIIKEGWMQYLDLPRNNCPNLIEIQTTSSGIQALIYPPNDFSGDYVFEVNATLPFSTNDRLKMEIANMDQIRNGPVSHIILRVRYPSTTTFPRITLFRANGVILCQDIEHRVGPRGRTKLWAKSTLVATIQRDQQDVQQVPRPRPTTESPPRVTPTQRPIYNSAFNTSNSRPAIFDRDPGLPPPFTSEPLVTRPPDVGGDSEACGFTGAFQPSIALIVDGVDVKDGEFPWMAAIYLKTPSSVIFRCSGSLISNRHVLTVGHCVQLFAQLQPGIEKDFIVVLGLTDLTNWQTSGVRRDVSKASVHPNFELLKSGRDLVVLTLSQSVSFDSRISPICLWNSGDSFDSIQTGGEIAGWGRTHVTGALSARANKITMPVVDFEDCLRSHDFYSKTATDYSFCGGTSDDDGPCVGDSGAGFFKVVNNRYRLRGMVAYLKEKGGTCDLQSYAVFTDIANDIGWIKSIMSST